MNTIWLYNFTMNVLKVIFFQTYNDTPSVGLNVYTDHIHITGLSNLSIVLLIGLAWFMYKKYAK